MGKYSYRIYIYFFNSGCEKVAVVYSEEGIDNVISKYDKSEYEKILIIKHDRELDMDIVYDVIYSRVNKLSLKRRHNRKRR